jgi:N-acetylglucosaminyldiphosphoundecaprenol N-acetyl-beta-D-mannosaminyltransferase
MHVDCVSMTDAVSRIDSYVRSGMPHQVVTVNLDFLRLGLIDRSFRDLVNMAELVIADGMPLVWGARLQGTPLPERVAGVDLVRHCAALAAEKNHRVFLLGAAPGVADRAAAVLSAEYPGLNIVGTHAPGSLSPEDDSVSVAAIRAAAPDILLVAFGAPRQEQWIRKHMQTLRVPVCIGVGGSFDMLSGKVSRAPVWMQRAGMEWFYRFSQEPTRLWKRYFVHDLPVFLRLLTWTLSADSSRAAPIATELSQADAPGASAEAAVAARTAHKSL